jgi:hypothetical protein
MISFLGGLIGLITGSIFSLTITRTLSPEEYGHWGLILSTVSYFPLILAVIGYWSTRETAQKLDSGKTALLSTIGLSVIASTIFIIISFFIVSETETEQNYFLLATILIPIIFLTSILGSIAYGYKPHVFGVSTIFYGVTQVISVFIFVYILNLGIPGIIFTLTLSYTVSIVVLLAYVHKKIKTSFKNKFLKKWLKLSWIPLYPSSYLILLQSTILIFVLITDSIIGVAYWTASLILASMIAPSGLISQAVYPKLLENKQINFFQDNVTHLFYFGILFTTLVITFARPGLFLLNPFYEEATPIVVILAIDGFLVVLINMFQNSLIGIEKVDSDSKSNYKDYLKSNLFYVHTLRLIQTVTYVVILIIVLILLTPITAEIDLLTYWASIALMTQIPLVAFLAILIKRNFINPFDFKRILKFIFTGMSLFAVFYFLIEHFLLFDSDLFQFTPRLLLFVCLMIGTYCIITYLTDSKIKLLFDSIICEIKNKSESPK